MADNVSITPGSGATIGTRDAGGGVEVQRVIPNTWNGAAATDVSATNPLPVIGNVAAASLSGTSAVNAQLTVRPGDWSVVHTPATNVQAIASKTAGGAGVRHVATSITATLAAGASAIAAGAPILLNLRDGATGAGTIIWSTYVNVPAVAAQAFFIHLNGLNIIGSTATALTLEFAVAGGTNSYESVTLTGYDVS